MAVVVLKEGKYLLVILMWGLSTVSHFIGGLERREIFGSLISMNGNKELKRRHIVTGCVALDCNTMH